MHSISLLQAEVFELREANHLLSRRRRAKKKRIRQGGTLTVEDVTDQAARKEAERQSKEDEAKADADEGLTQRRQICCGNCGKPGHNARTCKVIVESSNKEDSI